MISKNNTVWENAAILKNTAVITVLQYYSCYVFYVSSFIIKVSNLLVFTWHLSWIIYNVKLEPGILDSVIMLT